jgi:hypothetical protein
MEHFAISNGNFENPTIWNNNIVPNGKEHTVYSNGFRVNIQSDVITLESLRNTPNKELNIKTGGGFTVKHGIIINADLIFNEKLSQWCIYYGDTNNNDTLIIVK